jgi:hypothetical protein
MSHSSKKFAQNKGTTIAGGKEKKLSVKPQNVGGLFKKTQCPFFRQTADRTLHLSPFSIDTTVIHRVIHRSWGNWDLLRWQNIIASDPGIDNRHVGHRRKKPAV